MHDANVLKIFMVLKVISSVWSTGKNPPFVCVHYAMIMEGIFVYSTPFFWCTEDLMEPYWISFNLDRQWSQALKMKQTLSETKHKNKNFFIMNDAHDV